MKPESVQKLKTYTHMYTHAYRSCRSRVAATATTFANSYEIRAKT